MAVVSRCRDHLRVDGAGGWR